MKYDEYIGKVTFYLVDDLPEKEKDSIRKKYLKSLEERIRELEEKSDLFKRPISETLSQFFSKELDFIKGLSVIEKLMMYSEDEEYDKLSELSAKSYDLALKSINEENSLSEEEIREISKKMISICSNVKPFNKSRASILLSEGLLDLSFSQKKGDTISFRLANYFKEQREKSTVDEQRDPK